MILKPDNDSTIITLNYPQTLQLTTTINFDFKIFVIILILTYLLTYKLTDYVADFKTVQNKSRIDIAFLTVFFVFLFVPMSHIINDDVSHQENRLLTKWQPLIKENNEINFDFGKNFNDWFSDRFNLRDSFIKTYLKIKYFLSSNYAEVPLGYLYKSNGWMFYNQNQSDTNYPFTPLSQEELEKYTNNIKQLIRYCDNNEIKLYMIVFPTKEFLYQEHDIIHANIEKEKTKDLVEKIKKELGFEIIYPIEELDALKKSDYVFYKTDHHSTDSASFLVYKLLMKKIAKDFPDIQITTENDFKISYNNLTRWDWNRLYTKGSNYARAKIKDNKLLQTKYKYYDYKYPENIEIIGHPPHYMHINNTQKYKAFLIGNSFVENITYFLNTSFKRIEKYRFNTDFNLPKRNAPLDITGYIPLIEQQKPDMLIIILSTGYIDSIGDLYMRGEQ